MYNPQLETFLRVADAWLYGTTTTKEFTGFRKPVLENVSEVPDGDYIADNRADLV